MSNANWKHPKRGFQASPEARGELTELQGITAEGPVPEPPPEAGSEPEVWTLDDNPQEGSYGFSLAPETESQDAKN